MMLEDNFTQIFDKQTDAQATTKITWILQTSRKYAVRIQNELGLDVMVYALISLPWSQS